MLIYRDGFVILVFVYVVKAIAIFEDCSNNTECPAHAQCQSRWCSGRICLCEEGFSPSYDETRCLQAKNLKENCDSESMCRVPYSACINGTCQCHDGYEIANNLCKPFPFGNVAILGEECGGLVNCAGHHMTCKENRCRCEDGFRNATKEELALFPFILQQCLPESFKPDRTLNHTGDCPQTEITTSNTSTSLSKPSSSTTPSLPTSMTQSTTLSTAPTSTVITLSLSSSSTSVPSSSSTQTRSFSPSTVSPSTTKSSTTSIKSTHSTTTASTSHSPTTTKPTSTTSTTTKSTTQTTTLSTTKPTITTEMSSTSSKSSTVSTTPTTPAKTTTIQAASHSTRSTSEGSSSEPSTTTMFSSASVSTRPSTTLSSAIIPTSTKQQTTINATNSLAGSSSLSVSPLLIVTNSTTFSSAVQTTTVRIGNPCGSCPIHSDCEIDSCDKYRCRCKLGYATGSSEDGCRKLSALGEDCTTNQICQGPFTVCDGVCKCAEQYEPSDNGRWCRLKKSWFIDFPLLGERCSGKFTSECYMDFEQICVNRRCQCKEGLRGVGEVDDRNAIYPDISQCRNSSYLEGYRPRDICENQSRETYSSDLYSKAKSKIRRMQGAIIGGSIGGVALIGIIVGVIALVRWKRRERRGTMRDTSSTASTEGQRSRYSFKIPRPFANYVSQKEYDSNQISYPNTALESDVPNTHRPEPDITERHNHDSTNNHALIT